MQHPVGAPRPPALRGLGLQSHMWNLTHIRVPMHTEAWGWKASVGPWGRPCAGLCSRSCAGCGDLRRVPPGVLTKQGMPEGVTHEERQRSNYSSERRLFRGHRALTTAPTAQGGPRGQRGPPSPGRSVHAPGPWQAEAREAPQSI